MKRIIKTAVIIGDYHYNTKVVIMFADFATRTNYLLPYTIVLYFNHCVTYLLFTRHALNKQVVWRLRVKGLNENQLLFHNKTSQRLINIKSVDVCFKVTETHFYNDIYILIKRTHYLRFPIFSIEHMRLIINVPVTNIENNWHFL